MEVLKNMKKLLAFVLTLAMVTGMLSGCAGVPVAVEGPLGTVKEEVAAAISGEAVKTGLYVSSSLSAENATADFCTPTRSKDAKIRDQTTQKQYDYTSESSKSPANHPEGYNCY